VSVTTFATNQPLWFGIICSVIAGLALMPLPYLTARFLERRGKFAGHWIDEIFDPNNEIVKRDEIEMNQRGQEISGTIRRIFPEDQNYRRYKFRGLIRGESILVVFWSIDENIRSFGSWNVHHTGDFIYEGYYLSYIGSDIEKIPIKLTKIKSF
jgi:hypothetical protein